MSYPTEWAEFVSGLEDGQSVFILAHVEDFPEAIKAKLIESSAMSNGSLCAVLQLENSLVPTQTFVTCATPIGTSPEGLIVMYKKMLDYVLILKERQREIMAPTKECVRITPDEAIEDFFTELRALLDLEVDASTERMLEEVMTWKTEREDMMG